MLNHRSLPCPHCATIPGSPEAMSVHLRFTCPVIRPPETTPAVAPARVLVAA